MRALLSVLSAFLALLMSIDGAPRVRAQSPSSATLPPGGQVTSRFDESGFQSVTVQNQST